jgi:hypothetical protein
LCKKKRQIPLATIWLVVQEAIDLKSAGLDTDPAEFSEKTGYTLSEECPAPFGLCRFPATASL